MNLGSARAGMSDLFAQQSSSMLQSVLFLMVDACLSGRGRLVPRLVFVLLSCPLAQWRLALSHPLIWLDLDDIEGVLLEIVFVCLVDSFRFLALLWTPWWSGLQGCQ
jgi:hypothetical protein